MNLIDQTAREDILKNEGNILVSASAGSGKTTIMVKKMVIELDKITDHRTIAAITFTVKATNEIKKKASKLIKKQFFVMTNDSFIENEIIRPFIIDAFGKAYTGDYTVEYEQEYKFNEFPKGLEQLRQKKVLGSYSNNKRNFNFEVALKIIEKSLAAQEYIKSKYAVIFVDEYQDSDSDMHRLFMYLKNQLGLKLFIVGDPKQAIYLWRGAMSNIFEQVVSEDFNSFELITNFRCHKEIENYANLFHNNKYYEYLSHDVQNVILKEYNSYSTLKEFNNFFGFVEEFNSLIKEKLIDLDKEITIISNFNNDARIIAELLNNEGYEFVFIPKTPIDEGIPNGHLLKGLALYCKNTVYTIYDFIEDSGIDERAQTRFEVEKIINELTKVEELSYEQITDILTQLAEYLGISISKEETTKFYESVSDSRYDMAFQLNEKKYKVMTVFSSKGLEFDQVISFSRYYKIYDNEHIHNHYVCITRAKEKFVLLLDNAKYLNYFKKVLEGIAIKDIRHVINYVI